MTRSRNSAARTLRLVRSLRLLLPIDQLDARAVRLFDQIEKLLEDLDVQLYRRPPQKRRSRRFTAEGWAMSTPRKR
jgi:hypothetical protein